MIMDSKREKAIAEDRANISKDLLDAQLKTMVEVGGVMEEVCNFTAKIYAFCICAKDIVKDDIGGIGTKKEKFLKDIVDTNLNPAEKERFEYVISLILSYMTSSSRFSISLKRKEN